MIIQSITVCDHIRFEQDGKYTLCGVWAGLVTASGAMTLPVLMLAIVVEDAKTSGLRRVRIEATIDDRIIVHRWEGVVPSSQDHDRIFHAVAPFMIVESGRYIFRVTIEDTSVPARRAVAETHIDIAVGGVATEPSKTTTN